MERVNKESVFESFYKDCTNFPAAAVIFTAFQDLSRGSIDIHKKNGETHGWIRAIIADANLLSLQNLNLSLVLVRLKPHTLILSLVTLDNSSVQMVNPLDLVDMSEGKNKENTSAAVVVVGREEHDLDGNPQGIVIDVLKNDAPIMGMSQDEADTAYKEVAQLVKELCVKKYKDKARMESYTDKELIYIPKQE